MIVEYRWNGQKYEAAIIRCPYCNKINVVLYPIKILICEHCGKRADVEVEIKRDGSEIIPVWEWKKVIAQILAEGVKYEGEVALRR